MSQTTTKTPRLNVVDALRGFAVMAILLVHFVEHFIYSVYPDPASQPEWLNVLDKGVLSVVFTLFAGKAYAIFALLFGFTFYVQQRNQQLQGRDFGYRFLWRLVLLAGFASVNALFFPGGDVLLLFAILGVVLFAFRKAGDVVVFVSAIIFLLQPVEWAHYIGSLLNPDYAMPDLGVGAMYGAVSEYVASGDMASFVTGNLTLGQKSSLLWAVGAGRFFQTAGLFLLGMLIGRRGLFVANEKNSKFWLYTLIVASVAFAPLYQLKADIMQVQGITAQSAGVVIDMWQKFAFTAVLVASFVLLYQSAAFQRLTNGLRIYGKMSLTNYITQSIIGAIIFFPIGLNLAPYCGTAASLLIGVVVFVGQLYSCKWWLKTDKQGPLEALWHRLTWIKRSLK